MQLQAFESRDNGRTPFQWNSTPNAGFTTGTPWIKVNPNYTTINEEAEDKDKNSVLNYFRRIVKLRKDHPDLVYGKYTLLDQNNPNVYAYTRKGEGEDILVLLNFTSHDAKADIRIDLKNAKLLLSNYGSSSANNKASLLLRPYEAVIYQLTE